MTPCRFCSSPSVCKWWGIPLCEYHDEHASRRDLERIRDRKPNAVRQHYERQHRRRMAALSEPWIARWRAQHTTRAVCATCGAVLRTLDGELWCDRHGRKVFG